jgi:hypothetical protein
MSQLRFAVLVSSILLGVPAMLLGQLASGADLPAGPMQQKAATACTECHEARIVVQQRLSKATWTKEVDKMIKWGAVVDAQDHDALIDYLSTNFGVDRSPYQPERTAGKPHKSGTR